MGARKSAYGSTAVERHNYQKLVLYEVTKEELESLEKGSNSDLYLEIAIGAASVFASFLCSLLTIEFADNEKTFTFFIIVAVISFLVTVIFGLLWHRNRGHRSTTISSILSRPADNAADNV